MKTSCFLAAAILILTIFATAAGCKSFGERHFKIRDEFIDGKIDKAKSDVDVAIKTSSRKDVDLLKLNKAIIDLCSGRPKSAELLLREVRDNFDRIEHQKAENAAKDVMSMILDDNAQAYSGEDYEKVMIRVFLTIANLMQNGGDAYAYSMQINDKQNKIIESHKKEVTKLCGNDPALIKPYDANYYNVAIGAYISGLLQEETKRNYDDALRNYEKTKRWLEENKYHHQLYVKADIERVKTGVHSKSGNGVVYIIALEGEGPYKIQKNCQALHETQILTTAVLSKVSNTALIPDFAPVMIPAIVSDSRAGEVEIDFSIDQKFRGSTSEVTNISKMAKDQFDANMPLIITRAIVRRMLKKGAIYGTKKAVDANGWVGLALEVGGMIWESMETADTRSWNLLPNSIQISRVELPAGEHEITMSLSSLLDYAPKYYKPPVYQAYNAKFKIHDGRNTYILANFINGKLVGKITVSGENNNE
ncbi:MAG: hypothetical protein LBB88_11360 [Planctomycetaceae bacterium]|nr:hypothetical protein [Planctomycetaceae bacterium]